MQLDPWDLPKDPAMVLRRWALTALVLSIIVHLALLGWFALHRLERFVPATERLVPRVFTVPRTVVDAKLLVDDRPAPAPTPGNPVVRELNLPPEKPDAGELPSEVRIAPQVTEIAKPIAADRPRADSAGLIKMVEQQKGSAGEIDKALQDTAGAFLKDAPASPNQPVIRASDLAGRAGSLGSASGAGEVPGLQSLDDALAGGGSAFDPSKPIGIPGGALFAYDSADLGDQSQVSLDKLARLITRFPDALVLIEGHTDSFGSDEYNLGLSQRRAESVKAWLVGRLGIEPDRIRTMGLGRTRLLVAPDKSVEEQAPNRRVEISIKSR